MKRKNQNYSTVQEKCPDYSTSGGPAEVVMAGV